MNILVTGGAGFIGSHIADVFIGKGAKVIIIDNLSTGRKENINKKAKFYKMDICSPSVEQVFMREKIDIVNHHAAQINVMEAVKDPVFDARINIVGSLNILENCVKYKVKKIIFASSGGAIYGEGNDTLPFNEFNQPLPISPYGISKFTVEQYLKYYQELYNLNYTILRYSNVYGERQNPEGEAGVISIFTLRMLKGINPIIYGDGKQLRDYVYVGDVVRANLLAINKGTNQILNIGTGIPTSVNVLYKKLKKIIKFSGRPRYESCRKGEILKNYLNISKARKILKWTPEINLEQGLKSCLDYYKGEFLHG